MKLKAQLLFLFAGCLFLAAQQSTPDGSNKKQANPPAPPQQTQATPAQPASAQPTPAPKRVRTDLAGFELDKSRVQPATQVGGATRGNDAATILLAPHLGKAYALRPVFHWAQRNKANSFEFRLMNDSGEQIYTGSVKGTTFEYPENAPALKPGQTYRWTVAPEVSLLGGAPEPARFIVIDNPERDQVSSELLTEGPTADGRAKVLARHGLWYDAIEAYTALINSHASTAEFYEKRAEIYEQIPATQEPARIDREKAESLERQPQ
jgi:Domain of Unknown Function (DUF928)